MIYEVKLKEVMGMVFQELVKSAAIENKLAGSVKLANEEQEADYNSVDRKNVKLMKTPGGDAGTVDESAMRAGTGAAPAASRGKLPTPVAASPEAVQQFNSLQQRPLKTRAQTANPAPAPSTDQPQP
jgi:hypothetical protein